LNNRILELRKTLHLSQESFGQKIMLSKSGISNLERGQRTVTERTIKTICSTFNVNEEWLRTGEGDMFTTSEDLIEIFAYVLNDMSEIEKSFMTKYLSLPSDDRKKVVAYLKMLTSD
jgi:transcriptional regulator with XRE-family HTH domain